MADKTTIIAKALKRSGALKFGSFKLKSGLTSPYYIDLTWLLSSPKDFNQVVHAVTEEIRALSSLWRVDKLASIELKGALLLPSVAGKLSMPCIVVRKKAKTYGLTGLIVGGEVNKGERFIFFDDVITSGKSKLEGIRPIEERGGEIKTILVVVDREQNGKECLEKLGYQVKSITTISDITIALQSVGALSHKLANEILSYLEEQT